MWWFNLSVDFPCILGIHCNTTVSALEENFTFTQIGSINFFGVKPCSHLTSASASNIKEKTQTQTSSVNKV